MSSSPIFIAIAAYTDPELPRTLRDALEQARWPDRLRFGICWQADPQYSVCLAEFHSDSRFRIINSTRKRAHPDVFTGANPDPVTIHRDDDWKRCLTWEEARRRGIDRA